MSTVGVPTEVKAQEHRVALTPPGARSLVARGHRVLVERGAGIGSGYPDEEYAAAGAELVTGPTPVFEADIVVKVKEPQPEEVGLLRPGQILFTFLHLAADAELCRRLAASGATSIAYETIEVAGRLPLLEPMSEMAGRMGSLVGAYHLARHTGGRGVLLGGVPGVLPGHVAVLGGGTAGCNAARVARGLGAEVTILEIDLERMRWLDATLAGVRTLYSTESNLLALLPRVDLIIGAVLVPGARAPRLISRAMLGQLPRGAVLVDLAVDQGGCAETTRPTTHAEPTYMKQGVLHYGVTNMPAAYARTATQALTNSTARYLNYLADEGLEAALDEHPELRGGINTFAGQVTHPSVASAHGLPFKCCVLGHEMAEEHGP